MEVFPKELRVLWSKWELRVSILASLLLQLLLILLGSRRKRDRSTWLAIILWAGYLFADTVAMFALSVLSNMQGEPDDSAGNDGSPVANNGLLGFWAPFLLLHLGGPDTITAYSLEDNELWRRHLLTLLTQVTLAIYAFIRSLSGTRMLLPTALVFIAGVVKYAERTWALWYASRDHLRDALIDWPNEKAVAMDSRRVQLLKKYSDDIEAGLINIESCFQLLDKYDANKEAGLPARFYIQSDLDPLPPVGATTEGIDVKDILLAADSFFVTFKRLIVDVMLTSNDRHKSQSFFLTKSAKQAFQVVEIELGFFYSVLYTKSVLTHSYWGYCSRSATFLCILSTLSVFVVSRKHDYQKVDVIVTYVLLAGALVLEIYSCASLVFSDATTVQLLHHNWVRLWSFLHNSLLRYRWDEGARWSNCMGQYNVLSYCLHKHKLAWMEKIIPLDGVKEMLSNYFNTTHIQVSTELKELIFMQLKERLVSFGDTIEASKHLCNCRGQWTLQRKGYGQKFRWCIEVEFDESILIWHIATDMCFFKQDRHDDTDWKMIRNLSNYILYLLVRLPNMLPPGIGGIRFQNTCTDIKNTLNSESPSPIATKIEILLDKRFNFDPRIRGDTNKSVLFNAGRLANQLMELSEKERLMIIQQVWLEILFYAACHCKGYDHSQQLGSGGELLTHVWLLMAHLGLSEQYRIETASKKAKLIVGK